MSAVKRRIGEKLPQLPVPVTRRHQWCSRPQYRLLTPSMLDKGALYDPAMDHLEVADMDIEDSDEESQAMEATTPVAADTQQQPASTPSTPSGPGQSTTQDFLPGARSLLLSQNTHGPLPQMPPMPPPTLASMQTPAAVSPSPGGGVGPGGLPPQGGVGGPQGMITPVTPGGVATSVGITTPGGIATPAGPATPGGLATAGGRFPMPMMPGMTTRPAGPATAIASATTGPDAEPSGTGHVRRDGTGSARPVSRPSPAPAHQPSPRHGPTSANGTPAGQPGLMTAPPWPPAPPLRSASPSCRPARRPRRRLGLRPSPRQQPSNRQAHQKKGPTRKKTPSRTC